MNTQTLQILKKSPLFAELNDAELEAIAEIAKEKSVISGDYIFDEGAPSKSLYVVNHGSIDILKKGGGGEEKALTQVSAGSCFGDMGYLDREPRSAAAMARENTKLLEIIYADLDRLLEAKPAIGHKLYRSIAVTLARRVRQTTNNLASLRDLKLRNL